MLRILTAALLMLAALPVAWSFDDRPVVEWIAAQAVRLENLSMPSHSNAGKRRLLANVVSFSAKRALERNGRP